MARSLEALQKQYNSSDKAGPQRGMMGGPGGGPGGRRRMSGKPKNTANTIKRMFSYVSRYTGRLVLVAVCMLVSTVTSLLGSYMLAPIIDRITLAVNPNAEIKMSAIEKIADKVIEHLTEVFSPMMSSVVGEVSLYIIIALVLLLLIYVVGIVTTYLQGRIMLSISQNAIERIRNDLFNKLQKLPVRYFDSNPTGETMSRFTNDVDNIGVMLDHSLVSVFSGLITLIGTFVFMITTNWVLTLVTIVFIPIFMKGGTAIAKRSSKYYSGQQAALGAVN